MFYIAMGYGGEFMIDGDFKSAYEVHEGQSKPGGNLSEYGDRMKKLASNQIRTHNVGLYFSPGREVTRSIRTQIYKWLFIYSLFGSSFLEVA